MLIDWFTVGAQVLNFFILVWLLRRFLYRPILDAVDAREKRIAAALADAAAKKADAQKERDAFQKKNEDFDRERSALLGKATAEAKTERERLIGEARTAADALSEKRSAALKSEQETLGRALAGRTIAEAFAIARKALADLATASLEERMGEVFTRRLGEMDSEAKALLGAALTSGAGPAIVRSAFELPQAQRAAIQDALNQTFSAEIPLRFEAAPDLVGGIELNADGQKVGWSISGYLADLQEAATARLAAGREARIDTKPEAVRA